MPDWEESSRRLNENLRQVLRGVRDGALARLPPSVALARGWHRQILAGLTVPDPAMVGQFRGGPGLEDCEVQVGRHFGVRAPRVGVALRGFERSLRKRVAELDGEIAPGMVPTGRQLAKVLDLCAWAHAEWVRIHPMANGNGRTARVWANFLARRYGLPFFVRLRPRPDNGYGEAGAAAMRGFWQPTATVFRAMLDEFLRNGEVSRDAKP